MTGALAARLALALVLCGGIARGAAAQRASVLAAAPSSAVAPLVATPHVRLGTSDAALVLRSMGAGTVGALAGGLTGLMIDDAVCEREHRGEERYFFGPCFFYAGPPTSIGWFGGGVVGATWKAARVAQARGCRPRAAWWRALGGAVLGATPGSLSTLAAHGKLPPARSALVLTAPLVTGAGAALAVRGCRGG